MPRYLLIWQDNLLAKTRQVDVDYLGTGITITPFGTPDRFGLALLGRALRFALRLFTRHYDRVVLPAIDFTWHADPSTLRRWLRKSLAGILSLKPNGRTPLVRWFLPKHGLLAVLDRYDKDGVLTNYAKLVGADVYFKTNLTTAQQQQSIALGFKSDLLPYWLFSDRYAGPRREKDVDLCYCATVNSAARSQAVADVTQLQKEGLHVVVTTGRLPQEEYLALLQRSYLTLSPEGLGYHCFRHYEAMLCGSVPIINRAPRDYVTDLQDQKNCLLYDANRQGDLARVVKEALRNKPQLAVWGQTLRQFALDHHSTEAVGRRILQVIEATAVQKPPARA